MRRRGAPVNFVSLGVMAVEAHPTGSLWGLLVAVTSDAASLAWVLGVLWVFFFFVYSGLLLILRTFIGRNEPAFSLMFEDNLSVRWPVRLLRSRYLFPWVASPSELTHYSWFVRTLFWVSRVVGTIAVVFLAACVLVLLFGGVKRL